MVKLTPLSSLAPDVRLLDGPVTKRNARLSVIHEDEGGLAEAVLLSCNLSICMPFYYLQLRPRSLELDGNQNGSTRLAFFFNPSISRWSSLQHSSSTNSGLFRNLVVEEG